MIQPGEAFKVRLLDILLDDAAMNEPANRTFLLRRLPRGPVAAIGRHPAKVADLNSIVEATAGMGQLVASGEWALVMVARDALQIARGSEPGKALEALLASLETQDDAAEVVPVPEVVLGRDERLPVSYFQRGLDASQAVAKILVPRVLNGVRQQGSGSVAFGTGWLIAPGLLMTNYHVIEARKRPPEPRATEADFQAQAAVATVWFDYLEEDGPRIEWVCSALVHFDQRLDYALVRVTPPASPGADPSVRSPLQVVHAPPELTRGFRLNIIQHPLGGPKRVAIRSNFYYDRLSTAQAPDRIRYLTDTEPGSSGSPVLDDQWQVVALHHAAVRVSESVYKGEVVKYNNQGVAIHTILNNLPDAVRQEIRQAQHWAG